jgi:hypothetical protein
MAKNTAKTAEKTEAPIDAVADDDADLDDLEALLNGDEELSIDEPEADDAEIEEIEAEAESSEEVYEPSEDEIAAAAAGAELEEERSKIYESAPAEEAEIETTEADAKKIASTEKKAKKAKGPSKPKFDASIVPTIEMTTDHETPKVEGLAKKVAEKVNNIGHHLTTGAKLSNYTVIGLKMLFEAGSVSSKDLLEKMRENYSDGTARAQSNQIMNVLPAMKIAIKEGSTLKLNPALKEEIAEQLKKAIA